MPLQRRVPKFGFTNPNRVEYQAVNLGDIQKLSDAKKIKDSLDLSMMIDLGVAKKKERVKILSKGEYKIKLNIIAHKFSASAKKIIEDNGGSVTIVE